MSEPSVKSKPVAVEPVEATREVKPSTDDWAAVTAEAGDPLLDCLEALCTHFGRPRSADALTAGLPLAGPADPEIFVRAAARAGIRARLAARPLAAIDRHLLPCVLLLEGRGACLLTRLAADAAEIVDPATGGGTVTVPPDELAGRYTGTAIFAKLYSRLPTTNNVWQRRWRVRTPGSGARCGSSGRCTVRPWWPPSWSTCSCWRARCTS